MTLRQLFERLGQQVHLLTPTYPLFPEIAARYAETRLQPENNFAFDRADLQIPADTSLTVIVNPNNPNGGTFDMSPLSKLLERYPDTRFLVDEAFIGLAGQSVAHLVPQYPNLLVTRTLSKAHSNELNTSNDAYPLVRPSQAAALATLQHEDNERVVATLRELL